MKTRLLALPALTASVLLVFAPAAMADWAGKHKPRFWGWKEADKVAVVNSDAGDGCPIESPDGLSLYLASTRPSPHADPTGAPTNDIWASDRASKRDPFSEPVNLGAPVNSAFHDFCPTPLGGRWLMFVSDRTGPGTCNPTATDPTLIGDIYLIRQNAVSGWGEPQHLGCIESGTGPNSAGAEFAPSLLTTKKGTFLYFSSNVSGNMDIYVSRRGKGGVFGRPSPVHELNSEFVDLMPNVSADGLEIVFSSDRPVDSKGRATIGGNDIFVSTRSSTNARWSAPRNLGDKVNDGTSETRPSLSRDRKRLYFGRDGDIWVATRARKWR